MRGDKGYLILPFSLFKKEPVLYYKALANSESALVYEPFAVKVYCRGKKLILSIPPGSLVSWGGEDEDLALELGACIAYEVFWFKGGKISWKLKDASDWISETAKEAGFSIGEGKGSVLDVGEKEGEVRPIRPWHPANALEEGEPCTYFVRDDLLEVAGCSKGLAIGIRGENAFVGKIGKKVLPVVAYISSITER